MQWTTKSHKNLLSRSENCIQYQGRYFLGPKCIEPMFFFQEMVSLDQLNVMQNMKINIGYSSLFSIAVGMDDKVH